MHITESFSEIKEFLKTNTVDSALQKYEIYGKATDELLFECIKFLDLELVQGRLKISDEMFTKLQDEYYLDSQLDILVSWHKLCAILSYNRPDWNVSCRLR